MKAKVIILISLMMIIISPLMAQVIKEEDVPQDVFISFKYKYPDATVSSWETSKGNFLAKFNIAEQSGIAEFTANGKWLVSRFAIVEKELPTPITQYYKTNYKNRDFVIALSELVKEESGSSYYYVQVKKSGINQPKASELFFDLSGNLTKKNEPDEYKIEEAVTEPVKADTAKTKKQKEDKQKTNKEVAEKQNTEKQNTEKQQVVPDNSFNSKELPTSINNFVKTNYPDFSIKDTKFFSDPDMGDVYYLVLKQQGFKDEVELYFDITGTLKKTIDSREAKANKVKEEKKVPTDDQIKADEEAAKQKVEEQKKKTEGDTVALWKVPAPAKTHFVTKTKKPGNVKWYRVGRDYMVHFTIAGNKGQTHYSEEGNWIETRIDLDETSLTAMVIDYLKSNYRKLKIVKVENVAQAPKTKFIEVQMVEKNSKAEYPPVTKVFFDSNGKYMSDEKPDAGDKGGNNKNGDDDEFLSKVDASGDQGLSNDKNVNQVINKKELPTGILNYVSKNFKEQIIKESRYLFDDDLNTHVYYLTVKKEGDKNEIELYFSVDGKLLKKIDPTEKKAGDEIDNNEKVNTDEPAAGGDQKIDAKELPSGIKNYLKQHYPDHKVEEAIYKTDDKLGNVYYLTLKKSGNATITYLYFDLNGKLVKSEKSTDKE
jgi:hypothetical protein